MTATKDLQALRAALDDAELRLMNAIRKELEHIAGQFGVYPDIVHVDMVDASVVGERRPRYILRNVRIGVTL